MKRILSMMTVMLFLGLFQAASPAYSGELSYTPTNPSFGGSPFNAAPLLNNANAINGFTDPNQETFEQSLEEQLDNLVVSQLVGNLISNAFDDDGNLANGQFNTGLNLINVGTTGGVTTIQITNVATGETTTVQFPTF